MGLNLLIEQVIASGIMQGDKALMSELLFDCECFEGSGKE